MANFIGGNYSVNFLRLIDNDISDSDTPLLASALKRNTRIGTLDLSDNNITDAGRKVLLKAVFDTTSMDSIVESNHLCNVRAYTDMDQEMTAVEAEILLINTEKDDSIGKKIRKKVVLP